MKWIIGVALAGLLAALAWVVVDPGFDSGVAALAAALSFALAVKASRDNRSSGPAEQQQTIAKGGLGIQAGRDVNVGGNLLHGKTDDDRK